MSIQLADRSIKYPIGVCENLLVKISKFIFLVDFVVLEMDKDGLVSIILGRPFLVTARAVIDVHEGKLSLKEQWVDIVNHDGKWTKEEEEDNNEVRVLHVPSRYQYVDILTLGFPSALFEEFRTSLSIWCRLAHTAGEC
ncbi:DNA-directed DNA polymerase [Tanacetum coccineum]